MILLSIPASMTCDHKGCGTKVSVPLALLASGAIGVRPAEGWQIGPDQQGVLVNRCPEHRVEKPIIESAPVSLKRLIADAH